ncbi:hypothetical protein [Legionella cincinnatiensis]|uniref:Transmembrane protein n=1 Tax=Legionella cincinnatiensis TaxID=28085 RepID=A0A378IPV7_9GAMM|nr:hypothetical protein [Legionella cincinnatiensis]KTC93487.1 hypothetical protein Lcin_0525 [Legionella cincinnatiensis]STX36511.1 Uncharacterised protein [Legionella cincinnatiensis]
MKPIIKNRVLILILPVSLVILMMGLAIFGAYQSYSPVPFWDMWRGEIEFFIKISEGNTSLWWSQHNEHCILLSRLLFWIDLKWFDGSGLFLIVINYFLVLLSALLFWRIIHAIIEDKNRVNEFFWSLIITAWLFLWSQQENLVWPFQSQFFLAQILPLCAFYELNKAANNTKKLHFGIACILGLMSLGTMANGILALPLMLVYTVLTQQSKVRIFSLMIFTIIGFGFYFYTYNSASYHEPIQQSLKSKPLELLNYILMYLGNPFYFIFKQKVVAWLAGLILVVSSATMAIQLIPRLPRATLKLTLLFFIFYVEGTAVCTGLGRLHLGAVQSLGGRYTTPTIMAWASLLIVILPSILNKTRETRSSRKISERLMYAVLGIFLTVSIVNSQFEALQSKDNILFERKVAALALGLGVNDSIQIKKVYPDTQAALSIAQKASEKNLSIFGLYPFNETRYIGKTINAYTLPICREGSLTSIDEVEPDKRFVHVSGWLNSKSQPQMIRFLNSKNKIVGYAITKKDGLRTLYEGYLVTSQISKDLVLQGDGASCQLNILNGYIRKSNHQRIVITKNCEGYIDTINDAPYSPSFLSNRLLKVQGWLTKFVDSKAELPEAVLLVLTDNNGKSIFIKTRRTLRPDVGAHFKNPILDASGYVATADVSNFEKNYTLRLAYEEGNNIKICSQFKTISFFKKNAA